MIKLRRPCGHYDHTVILDTDGQLYACGENENGQIGIQTNGKPVKKFVTLSKKTRFISVGAGYEHTIAVAEDHSLWSWGKNSFGQLGLPTIDALVIQPSQIPLQGCFVSVDAGTEYSLALDKDGGLWSFGENADGTLGLGKENGAIVCVPQKIELPTITQYAAGNSSVLALDSNGDLWTWGDNFLGQLGIGSLDIKNQSVPIKIQIDQKFTQVSSGLNHKLVLDINRRVWSFGYNSCGCLGLGISGECEERFLIHPAPVLIEELHNIVQVTCSACSSFVNDESGSVWGCGLDFSLFDVFSIQDNEVTKFTKLDLGDRDLMPCGSSLFFC